MSRVRSPSPAPFTMRLQILAGVCALSLAAATTGVATQTRAVDAVSSRASQIHRRAIVVDTHDDTPQRLLFDKTFEIGRRHDTGSVDVPRMREGGLDALFFSIFVPGDITGPCGCQARDGVDRQRARGCAAASGGPRPRHHGRRHRRAAPTGRSRRSWAWRAAT